MKKVFVTDDKFIDVIDALQRRGWVRSSHANSPNFGLKWRNLSNINFRLVRSDQYINHLKNSQQLSNKALLASHLGFRQRIHVEDHVDGVDGKGSHPPAIVRVGNGGPCDPDNFFPRCWDLKTAGATSLLRAFAVSASVSLLWQVAGQDFQPALGQRPLRSKEEEVRDRNLRPVANSSAFRLKPADYSVLMSAEAIVSRYLSFLERGGVGHCRASNNSAGEIGVKGTKEGGEEEKAPGQGVRYKSNEVSKGKDTRINCYPCTSFVGEGAGTKTEVGSKGTTVRSGMHCVPQDAGDEVVKVGGKDWVSVVLEWEKMVCRRGRRFDKTVGCARTRLENSQGATASVFSDKAGASAGDWADRGEGEGFWEAGWGAKSRPSAGDAMFLKADTGAAVESSGSEEAGGGVQNGRVCNDWRGVGGGLTDPDSRRKQQQRFRELLVLLEALDPQARLMGRANAWVVKPAGQSCGRGVRAVSSLQELVGACRELGYRAVVQKYVERPLLVRGHKFDIRQWVLVTSCNPLVVWGFGECYIRFCSRRFTLKADSLSDSLIHLCNHSVQKIAAASPPVGLIDLGQAKSEKNNDFFSEGLSDEDSDGIDAEGNMWGVRRFREYLRRRFQGRDVFAEEVLPGIRHVVVQTLLAVREGLEKRGRGSEWLGFDLMLTEDLGVVLIEVNVSPDVSHSTPVTSRLAPAATEDALRIILDESDEQEGHELQEVNLRSPPVVERLSSPAANEAPVFEGWAGAGPIGPATACNHATELATKRDSFEPVGCEGFSLRWELWHKGKVDPPSFLQGLRVQKKAWAAARRVQEGVDNPEGAFCAGLAALVGAEEVIRGQGGRRCRAGEDICRDVNSASSASSKSSSAASCQLDPPVHSHELRLVSHSVTSMVSVEGIQAAGGGVGTPEGRPLVSWGQGADPSRGRDTELKLTDTAEEGYMAGVETGGRGRGGGGAGPVVGVAGTSCVPRSSSEDGHRSLACVRIESRARPKSVFGF